MMMLMMMIIIIITMYCTMDAQNQMRHESSSCKLEAPKMILEGFPDEFLLHSYLGATSIQMVRTPILVKPLKPSPIHIMAMAAPLLSQDMKPIPIIMAAGITQPVI